MQEPVGSKDAAGLAVQATGTTPIASPTTSRRTSGADGHGIERIRSRTTAPAGPSSRPGRAAGASGHMVRASRFGAPLRPTIARFETGRGCHCPPSGRVRLFPASRPAIFTGTPGVSVTEPDTDDSFLWRRNERISRLVHEPSNRTSAIRPGDRRGGSAHHSIFIQRHDRPPIHRRAIARPGPGGIPARVRRPGRSGQAAPALEARVGASSDVPAVQIGLDDACRRDEVGIVVDRAGHPVDVRRLEGRDLAQGVVVELAERDDRGFRLLERRRRRTAEVAEAAADERAGRRRGPRRLATDGVVAKGRLAGQGRPPGTVADGLVSSSIGVARVDARRDRPSRLRGWRTTAAALAPGFERSTVRRLPRSGLAPPPRDPGQRGIGVVDLGHPSRRRARCGGIVAGQVGMVGPGEAAPGRLDLRRRGARSHTEHDSRISLGHVASLGHVRPLPTGER